MATMSSQFPAYDPAARHGGDGPVVPQPAPPERRSYPTVAALEAADPVEVAAVLLRAVWGTASQVRIEFGRDDILLAAQRLVDDRDLVPPRFSDATLRVAARSITIWQLTGVVGLLPATRANEGCVLLSPGLPRAPLDVVTARLASGSAG